MSQGGGPINCPNCGYNAVYNYCAECGQPTHLHKETFVGLIMHFVAHYFHYDSKFMQTLKALWFSPGKLTAAYWERQRMRYIPPISLYIFISAVYFLFFISFGHGLTNAKNPDNGRLGIQAGDVSLYYGPGDTGRQSLGSTFLDNQADKIAEEYGSTTKFFIEKINHNYPKIFFCMIPFMALILKGFFRKRKDLYFVDHSIFSLHYHSFWFSIFILSIFIPGGEIASLLKVVLFLVAGIYMMVALRNAYRIGTPRAALYTIGIGSAYAVIMTVVAIAMSFLLFVMA